MVEGVEDVLFLPGGGFCDRLWVSGGNSIGHHFCGRECVEGAGGAHGFVAEHLHDEGQGNTVCVEVHRAGLAYQVAVDPFGHGCATGGRGGRGLFEDPGDGIGGQGCGLPAVAAVEQGRVRLPFLVGVELAAAESLIGLYKTEALRPDSPIRSGPLKGAADVEYATTSWVHWYNTERIHTKAGNTAPIKAENQYHQNDAGHRAAA